MKRRQHGDSEMLNVLQYNMTTIVAILIIFKDHRFPTIYQIESKLGGLDRGNMEFRIA